MDGIPLYAPRFEPIHQYRLGGAVDGFLMPPLGWKWAGFVWAYALVWALVSDQVKLLAYRILDPVKADSSTPGKR